MHKSSTAIRVAFGVHLGQGLAVQLGQVSPWGTGLGVQIGQVSRGLGSGLGVELGQVSPRG
eukprot:231205-Chlamydomonas_euryale.AAC.1